ncbi:MAG TPA: putative metal-binding motif-containing protein [Myxococcota bacterium]|nr:putative metal-binding motif-containing protein [Myxococcota bacterium]
MILLLLACGDKDEGDIPEDTDSPATDSPVDSPADSPVDSVLDTGPFDSDGDGVVDGLDCAPEDGAIFQGAVDDSQDGVDQNCDGVDGTDVDGDGYAAIWTGGADCDDLDATVYPGAASSEAELCTVDADGDGYGSDTVGTGVDAGTDCDDSDDHVSPWHGEWIDGKDNDCDGSVDEEYGEDDAAAVITTTGGVAEVGNALALVEDLDGDGLPELLVSGEGIEAAFLWTGRLSGEIDLLHAPLSMEGDTGWLTARSLASGELTGDGVADLLVAVPRYYDGNDYGGTFVISGSTTGSVPLAEADAAATGPYGVSILGYGVTAVDLDGDGQDDLATGSSMWPPADGRILGFLGPLSGASDSDDAVVSLRPDSDGSVNWPVLTKTDHDGDGLDELVVGAPYDHDYQGSICVVPHGETGSVALSDVASLVVGGEEQMAYPGLAVATGGDVDGDGLGDIIFGGHNDAWLVWGNTTGSVGVSDAPVHIDSDNFTQVGHSVALGDWNADGAVDFAVGAPNVDPGEVYLFLNGHTGTLDIEVDPDRVIVGRDEDGGFGTAMVGGVDLSGDFVPDLLVGAPWSDSQVGHAWLMEGP